MDYQTFTNLTGSTVSEERYNALYASAAAELEQLLGWPLDSWDDQYLEIGKTREQSCPDVDTDITDLDPPDDVVGSTRLYTWHPEEPFLGFDPATAVHAIKLVKDGITYKTYEPDEFRIHWENGPESWTRYAHLKRPTWCGCRSHGSFQVAVDADWLEELPQPVINALVILIKEALDPKAEVRSESRGTHSYTKYDREPNEQRFAQVIRNYAGPKGRRRVT